MAILRRTKKFDFWGALDALQLPRLFFLTFYNTLQFSSLLQSHILPAHPIMHNKAAD